ncbi:MAG: TonB-dependent receptor [Steroidobacteraceae bacterium]
MTFAAAALAAESPLEEVVVSATKRGDANVQDVPLSIQALGGATLQDIGAVDFGDYFRLVPGLSILEQGSGDRRYIVRGVNSAGAGTVGLYLDEVIITGENAQDGGGRQPDVRLFDIDRVEVLKGPQGTTFGSSSLAGTIRYITRKPQLGVTDSYVQLGVESIEGGDSGWQLQSAVNVPLGEKGALRAAGMYRNSAGYIDNMFRRNANGSDVRAGRLTARFEPADNWRFSLMAMIQDMQAEGPVYFNRVDYLGAALSPGKDYFQADIVDTAFVDKMRLYNATFEFDLPAGRLTAVASRMDRDAEFSRDSSMVMQRFVGRPAYGAGRSAIIQPKQTTLDTFELRLASVQPQRLGYLFGLFSQREDRDFRSSIQPAPGGHVVYTPGYSLNRIIDTDLREYAAFGELSWEVTNRLTLTAGARYYHFGIDEIANNIAGFSGAAGTGLGNKLHSEENGTIFRANAAYKFDEDQMAYLQVAQGFRPGGTNDQVAALIAGVTIPQGFNSDSLVNYELGYKATLLGGRLRFNPAVYLIDWDDIQLSAEAVGPGGRFPYRANGGGAQIRGAELDLAWFPVDSWEISLGLAKTDAQLVRDNPLPASGLDGDHVPYVPDFTAALSTRYEWPLGLLRAHVGGDLNYVGRRNTEYRPNNASYVRLDAYTLLNLRFGLRSDSGWDAVLNINNVTNDDTQIDVFRIVAGLYPDGIIINRPRTLALTVTKRFE